MTTAYIRRIDTLDGKKSTITWMVDGAGYSMGCDAEQADIIMQASNSDRAEIERLKQREAHFASVLSVADGGQYRNDWDAAIRRVVQERDAARADAKTLRMEYQLQRNTAISAQALLDATPDELRQRVDDAERIAAELRTGLRRYEQENGKLLTERDEARAEVERLQGEVKRLSSQMVVRMDDRPDDIEKCPFCGGNGLVRAVVRRGYEMSAEDDPDRLAWYIVCHACAAQGGWSKSRTGAVRLWQMRIGTKTG